MPILEEPALSFLFGAGMAVLFLGIQLISFRARTRWVRWIPAVPVLLAAVLSLLIACGVFGKGSGFLGGLQILAAAILAIPTICAACGVIAGWIIHLLYGRSAN